MVFLPAHGAKSSVLDAGNSAQLSKLSNARMASHIFPACLLQAFAQPAARFPIEDRNRSDPVRPAATRLGERINPAGLFP